MATAEPRPAPARSPLPRLILRVVLALALAAVGAAAVAYRPGSGPTLASLWPLTTALAAAGGRLAGWLLGHLGAVAAGLAAAGLAVGTTAAAGRRHPVRDELTAVAAVTAVIAATAAFAGGRLAIGVAASLALAALLSTRRARSDRLQPPPFTTEALLLILLAAATVRFVALAEQSPGFGTHSSAHLQLSLDLYERVAGGPSAEGATTTIASFLWPTYVAEQHGPMAVVNAAGFALFGIGFVQARMTQALLGVITVLLAHLLGRRLMDERLGLTLAFLLAFAPWHIAISRFNDAEHVLAPLQALLALWLVLRAFPSGGRADAVLAGLGCAAGWYVYATNQVLLAAVAAYLFWLVLRRRRWLRADRWRLPLFGITFLLASLPHVLVSVRAGKYLLLRTSYHTDGQGIYTLVSPRRMLANLVPALRQLFVQVDDQWFTRPAGGGLEATVAALAACGLLLCLLALGSRRFRDQAVLLLLWLVTGFLPAVLLAQVEFRRLLLVALLATVLAAVALARCGVLLAASGGGRRMLAVLVPPALAAFAAVNLHLYFDRVRVPESASSTYYPAMVQALRAHIDLGPTVFVLPADGRQGPEHRNSIRLGAYDLLRPRQEAGVPLDEIYRLAPVGELATTLLKLRAGPGSVQVVIGSGLLDGTGDGLAAVDLLHRLAPDIRPEVVRGPASRPELETWTLPPSMDGSCQGDGRGPLVPTGQAQVGG